MKKYLLMFLLASPGMLTLLSSCSKDDDNDPPKTKRELLVQSPWKYKSAMANGVAFTTFLSCETDNTVTFNNSGNGVVGEGATKCDPADPQTRSFTWSLQSNDMEILLSSPLFTNAGATLTLVAVSETELVVNFPVSTFGPIVIVEVTFQH